MCDPSTVLLSDISRCDLSYGPRGPRDKALNCVKVVFYFMIFFLNFFFYLRMNGQRDVQIHII